MKKGILLTTATPTIKSAVQKYFGDIDTYNADCVIPKQPTAGHACCEKQIKYTVGNYKHSKEYLYIMSVVNSIEKTITGKCVEIVNVMIQNTYDGTQHFFKGGEIQFKQKYLDAVLSSNTAVNLEWTELGLNVSINEIICKAKKYCVNCDKKDACNCDWIAGYWGLDRQDQIESVLEKCNDVIHSKRN